MGSSCSAWRSRPAGFAAEAPARPTVDLLSEANIRIDGAANFDLAGISVADAGDATATGAEFPRCPKDVAPERCTH